MLGLLVASDPQWGDLVVRDMTALLADHAHCEMKAASNALSLVARYAGMPDVATPRIVEALVALAREEMAHFEQVLTLLHDRGGSLGNPPVDFYAHELRTKTAGLTWDAPRPRERALPFVDRLLVAALIEARSAERFKLVVDSLDPGSDLRSFYEELLASEARHHRVLVDLARDVLADDAAVKGRLLAFARVEADLVRASLARGPRATIHG